MAMRTWLPLAALFLTGWFGGGVALAQPSKTARTVQDDLGLFSAEAKSKANAEIARIKREFHKDLMIETTPPPKQPKDLDVNDTAAVDKFIDTWVKEKFKNEQIDGVHVLFIEKNKLHKLRIAVGPKTIEKGVFTIENRKELEHRTIEKMKAGDKDGALLAATSYVGETMQHNSRSAPRAAAPADVPQEQVQHGGQRAEASPIFRWILIGLGVLLVIWIVSAVIRGLSHMGSGGGYGGGGYGPGYGGGGGGGFLNGFLGGMFGAAAGMWAYNHFFGGGTPAAQAGGGGFAGGSTAEATDVGAGEPSVGGGDYGDVDKGAIEAPDEGGGGGDWGGGGGDAGGGDAGGGGDWGGGGGGGDWGGGGGGGGGGDWGGGGGDWGGGGGGGGDW
jgi:uncharacterized protein